MKVCKKCKRHVANKTKICKYCGTDVSKARIIKNNEKVNSCKPKKVNNDFEKKEEKKLILEKKISDENVKKTVLNKRKQTKNKEEKLLKKTKKIGKRKHFLRYGKNLVKETFKNVVNILAFINKLKLLFDKIKQFLIKFKEYFHNNKVFNVRLNYKILLLVIICLVALGFGSYFGVDAYRSFTNADNTVVVGEKATTEKIFGMGDLITYNGIDYKVVKVETSEGNSYKAPKEGNQFLVVTVYMKNNTGDKVQYSYKNWTMSNSKGEEEKRIFTSVNVDTALYSGDLVIGGIKTGSMVFEQPINDPKLRMNFYELKKDKNGEQVIDTNKKIFSVSVKVPEENENVDQGKNSSTVDESNVKAIKTSDKKQS